MKDNTYRMYTSNLDQPATFEWVSSQHPWYVPNYANAEPKSCLFLPLPGFQGHDRGIVLGFVEKIGVGLTIAIAGPSLNHGVPLFNYGTAPTRRQIIAVEILAEAMAR